MSRAVVKVQEASTTTSGGTLARNDSAVYNQANINKRTRMQANGAYFDGNGYDSYDNSGYGSGSPTSDRTNSVNWKNAPPAMNGRFDDFNFGTALDDGHLDALNSPAHPQDQDGVGQHLLYETALLDTRTYKILDIAQVDALKKEHERLDSRIEALNRKLALESKVKDAAQNLQRLYSNTSRPDTPQSPDSPKKSRNSLLGSRRRNNSTSSQTVGKAEDEFLQSIKKVDELNESIKDLLTKRLDIERKLLRHTAAVLADQASRSSEPTNPTVANGFFGFHDDQNSKPFNEFDSIRDILRGVPLDNDRAGESTQKLQEEHEQQLASMQSRLEQLNSQLRGIITEASRSRGQPVNPEPAFGHTDDIAEQLENTFAKLELNADTLEQDQLGSATDVEGRLQNLNSQLHDALVMSSETEVVRSLPKPPQATGHGEQDQLRYLEDSLLTLEQILQHHDQELQTAREMPAGTDEAEARAAALAHKNSEYETVLSGLWELMSSDNPGHNQDHRDGMARSPLKEDFSVQAFSSRVQHLAGVASTSREQQDILRRQIQQQRELNGKSDMEKDREISDWQSRHDELQSAHGSVQQQLIDATAAHAQAEREASENRSELMNVANELEQLKRTVDTRAQEIETHRSNTANLQKQVQDMEAQMNDHTQLREEKEHAERRHEDLESEVARLRTELTIAQADLDSAYGTRAQRQREAGMQASEVEALKQNHAVASQQLGKEAERTKALEKELQEMTAEFQEMMRETMELEKERGQLENLIDGLRDRCDALEAQLSDEKVRWMGVKSPGGAFSGAEGGSREATSVMVLRQEFKKMVREVRTEGIKLLRTEQEERRKLESEVRRLRQTNGPATARSLSVATSSLSPGPTRPITPTSLTPASALGI